MIKLRQVALSVCIAGSFSVYTPQSNAVAGFSAGYTAACGVCDAAIGTAFQAVDASIIASEQVLMESMGMGASMASGAVGFPMLQSIIDGSTGKQTQQIVKALELATKQIAQEVREIPGTQQVHKLQQTVGKAAISHTQDSCKGIDAGTTFNAGGSSSLSYGLSFLNGRSAVIGSDMSANENATNTTSGTTSGGQISQRQAITAVATNVKNSTRIAQGQAIDIVRTTAEDQDLNLFDVIGGNLLISDKYTTIKRDSIEDDNLDLMAQLVIADLPSTADAVQATATTGAATNQVVESKLNRMGMTVPMAIQDRFVRLRRAHTSSLDAEGYMLSAMGEQLDGPLSDEGFLKLMGTKRVRDNRWLAITAVDDRFATQELAVMESEHLYLKYQKYLAKRDLNFALSQVLAKSLQKERP
jgi:hypothetical protein